MVCLNINVFAYYEVSKLLTGRRCCLSIWVYQLCVSDMDHETNASAFQVDSDFWSNTFSRPNADACAEIFVGAEGLYRANVVGFERSCFTFSSAVD